MELIFKKNNLIFPFLYNELEKAKRTIKIAVAWFTDPEILKLLLIKASEERVVVTVILFNHEINLKLNDLKLLNEKLRYSTFQDKSIMHHKFVIIDDKSVITGSYNWTIRARNYNRENVLQIFEEKIIKEYITEFENLISNSKPQTEIITFKQMSSFETVEDLQLLGLEQKFNKEILSKIAIADKANIAINIPLAYSLVRRHTAVIAATQLARAENGTLIQKALEKLHESGNLHLSFEESMIKKEYSKIFKDKSTIEFARNKLAQLKYFEDNRYIEKMHLY